MDRDLILLDRETRRTFSGWLRGLHRGRPAEIDLQIWQGWIKRIRCDIEVAEVIILAMRFGPGVYQAINRPDLAEAGNGRPIPPRPNHPRDLRTLGGQS